MHNDRAYGKRTVLTLLVVTVSTEASTFRLADYLCERGRKCDMGRSTFRGSRCRIDVCLGWVGRGTVRDCEQCCQSEKGEDDFHCGAVELGRWMSRAGPTCSSLMCSSTPGHMYGKSRYLWCDCGSPFQSDKFHRTSEWSRSESKICEEEPEQVRKCQGRNRSGNRATFIDIIREVRANTPCGDHIHFCITLDTVTGEYSYRGITMRLITFENTWTRCEQAGQLAQHYIPVYTIWGSYCLLMEHARKYCISGVATAEEAIVQPRPEKPFYNSNHNFLRNLKPWLTAGDVAELH